MIKFQITALAPKKRPKGTELVLRHIEPALGPKRQYVTELNKLLRGIAAAYRSSVLPALKNYRRFANDSERQAVVDDETWFISLESQVDQIEVGVNAAVVGLMALEANRHTKAFIKSARAALGVDLNVVIRNEDLEEYLRDAAARNAALIKSLRGDAIKDIRLMVLNAKRNGISAKKLGADIQARFKIHQNRAKLIAEDQLNKLTGDLNRIRQTQAGIKEYTWRTSSDERVRRLHRRLNGLRYRWGQATGAEGGLPPGQPIRCRCSAVAVVVF